MLFWLVSRLTMRTTVNVKEGEQLYMTYTYILSGTRSRQELLNKGKYFGCNCERCADPTELGTHFSSILCRKCKGGIIVPKQPLGKYFCNNFTYHIGAKNKGFGFLFFRWSVWMEMPAMRFYNTQLGRQYGHYNNRKRNICITRARNFHRKHKIVRKCFEQIQQNFASKSLLAG